MKWIAWTAGAAVLLAGLFLAHHLGFFTKKMTVETGPGETTNFTLLDGTEVWLNENSRLTYPAEFRSDRRLTTLDGEAYFSVTKNEEQPFCIETRLVNVTVLGTKFNLRAYAAQRVDALTVEEGRVRFKPKHNRKSIIVNGGELCFFNAKSKTMELLPLDEPDRAPWRK